MSLPPIEAGNDNAILNLIRENGIPSELIADDARELTGGKWKQEVDYCQGRHNLAEPYSQLQNERSKNWHREQAR